MNRQCSITVLIRAFQQILGFGLLDLAATSSSFPVPLKVVLIGGDISVTN